MPVELSDILELRAGNERINKWMSYDVVSDLYEPEGPFNLVMKSSTGIKKGDRIQLFVNDRVESTCIVGSIKHKTTRTTRSVSIAGKSVTSILSKSSVTEFSPSWPTTLPAIAERLLRKMPFVGKKDFVYNSGSKTVRIKRDFLEVSPGDTAFDVLKKAANSQGFIFWCTSDGKLTFDYPAATGKAEFKIDGRDSGCDYLEGSYDDSIDEIHSDIIVRGESQDTEGGVGYTLCKLKNSASPFYCPLVITWNEAERIASKVAAMHVANEKASGQTLDYTMPGHSQNGKNWAVNKFCAVNDFPNEAKGVFIITSRRFSLGREDGRKTILRLNPGVRI